MRNSPLARREFHVQIRLLPMMKLIFQVLILSAVVSLKALAAGDTFLGVLEEPQCKEGRGLFVRVLYLKHDDIWKPLSTATAAPERFDDNATWDIALDGRSIGSIRTTDPGFTTDYAWTYSRDRLLNVSPIRTLPHVPNRNEQFAGWCGAPHVRPLVVVANGGAADPDQWKPIPASASKVTELFREFREHANNPVICPRNSDQAVKFAYGPVDVRVLEQYRDRDGRQLVTLAFKSRKDRCDGPDDGWDTQTYFFGKTTTYLGTNLKLVDAGDYGKRGSSELLFWISRYNNDGYVLFSPETGKQAEYLWSYH